MAKVFKLKAPTFERLVSGYMTVAASEMRKMFVDPVAQIYSTEHLKEQKKTFKNFPYAIEAVDVTFQQANRPFGIIQEGKNIFPGNISSTASR